MFNTEEIVVTVAKNASQFATSVLLNAAVNKLLPELNDPFNVKVDGDDKEAAKKFYIGFLKRVGVVVGVSVAAMMVGAIVEDTVRDTFFNDDDPIIEITVS